MLGFKLIGTRRPDPMICAFAFTREGASTQHASSLLLFIRRESVGSDRAR